MQRDSKRINNEKQFVPVKMTLDNQTFIFDFSKGEWYQSVFDNPQKQMISQINQGDQLSQEIEKLKLKIEDTLFQLTIKNGQIEENQQYEQILTNKYIQQKIVNNRIFQAKQKLQAIQNEMGK